jgi:hypothetical protein
VVGLQSGVEDWFGQLRLAGKKAGMAGRCCQHLLGADDSCQGSQDVCTMNSK